MVQRIITVLCVDFVNLCSVTLLNPNLSSYFKNKFLEI
jgi:hypothetical protein